MFGDLSLLICLRPSISLFIMIKSPLRFPGGKSRAVKSISQLIPDFDEYREPFLGGGSVFLYAKQRFPDKKFWVNDLHFDLFKFWEISQKDCAGLTGKIDELRNMLPVGRELHKFLKLNLASFEDLERAAAFFILNRITFSGTSLNGGFSQSAFTGRFTESSIRRLNDFADLINGTKITNLDYENLVKSEGKNVFIYLDPPYHSAKRSALYGKRGQLHKTFDHERFAQTMKNCVHNWLITYDDCDYIRELFSFAEIRPWELVYGMRNVSRKSDQKGRELFISNYF